MAQVRPVSNQSRQRRSWHSARRWPGVSWWFSLLFVAGLGAWGLTLLFDIGGGSTGSSPSSLEITVVDLDSLMPIAGAEVGMSGEIAITDDNGVARLAYPEEPEVITVAASGYVPIHGQADTSVVAFQSVGLRPSGEAEQAAVVQQPTAEPTPVNVAPTAAPQPPLALAPTGFQESMLASAASPGAMTLSGIVRDNGGQPIWQATVLANGAFTETGTDGTFALEGVSAGSPVRVWASGYADQFLEVPTEGSLDVSLERQDIKAAYLTGPKLGDQETFDYLINTINATELNALVIVVKEYNVYYETGVQFFQDADAVQPLIDPAAMVAELHANGIYAIARLVVFNDPVIAEAHPELAVKDINGGVWRGYDGHAWVNPFQTELYQPNIDLALELAGMGFDEIQYDYIRFPSDGDLSTSDFGPVWDEEARVGAIVSFLEMTQKQLKLTGTKLAVDVFGVAAVFPDDQGIGQRIADFAPVVDYVCPMVYPSHFDDGFMGLAGNPNDLPYETIELSIGLGQQKIPGMELKMRPWLQDFSWGDREYGPEEVRAQIDATMDQGASGWMLWNPDSYVTIGALQPSSE